MEPSEGDAGGPRIAPGAIGARHLRFFSAQNEERGVGEGVVGDEEEGEHGDDAFEGAEDEEDADDGAEEQGQLRSAAFVDARDGAEEETVVAHGVEDAGAK